MAPKIIELLKGNKRKNNQGPIDPITREEAKGGKLLQAYEKRARYDPFAQDVVKRVRKVGQPKIGEA